MITVSVLEEDQEALSSSHDSTLEGDSCSLREIIPHVSAELATVGDLQSRRDSCSFHGISEGALPDVCSSAALVVHLNRHSCTNDVSLADNCLDEFEVSSESNEDKLPISGCCRLLDSKHEDQKLLCVECTEELSLDVSSQQGCGQHSVNAELVEGKAYRPEEAVGEDVGFDSCCGSEEEYFLHNTQRIFLVSCGVTDCNATMGDIPISPLPAWVSMEEGAVGYGVRQLSDSVPSYSQQVSKWSCDLRLPQLNFLCTDSHGQKLGNDLREAHLVAANESVQIRQEEQVKLAKRLGLIHHLPCGIYDGCKKNPECIICMEDFVVGDRVRYLPCMHTYHMECIDDWLVRSFTCPSCLEPVDAALLSSYETS